MTRGAGRNGGQCVAHLVLPVQLTACSMLMCRMPAEDTAAWPMECAVKQSLCTEAGMYRYVHPASWFLAGCWCKDNACPVASPSLCLVC